MRRAVRLAEKGWGRTAPNPLVGAVLIRDGEVVGSGYHREYGAPHAEVMAIAAAGERARGATLVVNLEPCNHHGQTPPCSEAIVAAGIDRVVIGVEDPNPVARGGMEELRRRGLSVETGVQAELCKEINAPFLWSHRSPLPFVTLKLALSLDSSLADGRRSRGYLTGPRALREVHRMRAGAGAIAVGQATVVADDPLLTVRGSITPRVPPLRVVFSRGSELPPNSRLVRGAADLPTLHLKVAQADAAGSTRQAAAVHVERVASLHEGLLLLRERGVRHLLVEGGAQLTAAFLNAGLVHRLTIFRAPVVLGRGSLGAFGGVNSGFLGELSYLPIVADRMFGADRMTTYALQEL